MNDTKWIVLANASRARIFEARDERKPKELASLVHPRSRMKGEELQSDRAGHSERPGDDGAGSAYEGASDPRRKEHRQFAREIAQALDQGLAGGRCDALIIVASNPFLGELRASLSEAAARAVVDCVAKDLTEIATLDLQHRLAELLAPRDEG